MFYSPGKQVSKYTVYKAQEIKALRESLQNEKITMEELELTKAKLDKLKKEHLLLQQENHLELKSVLKASNDAITDLLQQQTMKDKQIAFKDCELKDLEDMKQDLQIKGSKAEDQFQKELEQKYALAKEKSANDDLLLVMEGQIQKIRSEIQSQKQIKRELEQTESDLTDKLQNCDQNCQRVSQNNQQLNMQIQEQLQKIRFYEESNKVNEVKIQNMELKVQNSKCKKQIYEAKLDISSIERSKNFDNKVILDAEMSTEKCLDDLIRYILEETTTKEKEQIAFQRQSKQFLTKVALQEQIKAKLQERIAHTKFTLKLVKDKNENLKVKMNDIFRADTELISAISSKKVYQNGKKDMIDCVGKKQQILKEIQNKQNQNRSTTDMKSTVKQHSIAWDNFMVESTIKENESRSPQIY